MSEPVDQPPLPERLAGPGAPIQGHLLGLAYLAITVGLAAMALYLHTGFGHRLMSPQVLFPSLGAVWFAFRTFYKFVGRG